jgi:hypothetical protein
MIVSSAWRALLVVWYRARLIFTGHDGENTPIDSGAPPALLRHTRKPPTSDLNAITGIHRS